MTPEHAKSALDKIISKARVHLYKPIQIAEILHRDRVYSDINLSELETYRTRSKAWRDVICIQFLGRVSTSSAKFQDNLFEQNACPPTVMEALGLENRKTNGAVEAYIYKRFEDRFSMMTGALSYVSSSDQNSFNLRQFLDYFWREPGLRRSIDKIYEIVVYSLFSALIEGLEVSIEISINPDKHDLFEEFNDFTKCVMQLGNPDERLSIDGRIHRVGVTNAADRGLDMWANFGLAIQIKHLSLTEELAEEIVSSVSSDRIVIVCKDSEEKVIVSLLNQIGWKAKIQSIITENNLVAWYERALKGKHSPLLAPKVLSNLKQEIMSEFPTTNTEEFRNFLAERGYLDVHAPPLWS